MYHRIVRNKLRQGYADISRANFDPVLSQFAPDIHFSFAGVHAIGGDFRRRETVRQWFERIHRLFPGLQLTADDIMVSGPPWNTLIAARFNVEDTLPDGTLYQNKGFQIVRLRWGKIVEDHLIEDTARLCEVLQRLQTLGNDEAAAPPLQDA
jgi:ketosteroid isomerase-like protein